MLYNHIEYAEQGLDGSVTLNLERVLETLFEITGTGIKAYGGWLVVVLEWMGSPVIGAPVLNNEQQA